MWVACAQVYGRAHHHGGARANKHGRRGGTVDGTNTRGATRLLGVETKCEFLALAMLFWSGGGDASLLRILLQLSASLVQRYTVIRSIAVELSTLGKVGRENITMRDKKYETS